MIMNLANIYQLATSLIRTVHEAGIAIMGVYNQDFAAEYKLDGSPVTKADQLAEDIILASLKTLAPDIPVIAEEAASAGQIPEVGSSFFLVDPLDGTKEFVSKNGEFTVNIALIDHGVPIFGIVYAPAISLLYVTLSINHSVKLTLDVESRFPDQLEHRFQVLKTKSPEPAGLKVIASRSHMNEETRTYLDGLKVASLINAGSSLKFCRLAEGSADIYPRFAPTMEWDTAAGHAVLLAAGGAVLAPDNQPLRYGKKHTNYLNSNFTAFAQSGSAIKYEI